MRNIVPVELVNENVRDLSYQVLFDLDGDNIFETDLTEDCTIDYVNVDLEIKSPGEALGKPSSSTASITLYNETGRYSPYRSDNIESEHTGWKFRRNTKVQILAGFIDADGVAQTQELFQGVITVFKNGIKNGDKTINLTLMDLAKFAQKRKNPNHSLANGKYYEAVLFDVTIADAVSYLIDYCYGESFPRDIDNLTFRYPVIEFPTTDNIWPTIQKLAEACGAKCYFEYGQFHFHSPLATNYTQQTVSQYTFIGDNIFDLTETIDEANLYNEWVIESDGKTLQPRAVIVGTPTTNVLSETETYTNTDGKNAFDGKTITLKTQDPDSLDWINSINVPLVDTTTYSDLLNPTQDDINTMNQNSTFKVWDMINNVRLTIQDIDLSGQIILKDRLDITHGYNLQVTTQYYVDRILKGKYKDYQYSLDKVSRNIELPVIEANDGINEVTYSTDTSSGNLYLSKWTILDGNSTVQFRLTNNTDANTVYIATMNIYGNPLDCVNHLKVVAKNDTSITEFENSNNITNNYIIDSDWAQQVADYYLYRTEDEKAFIDITTKGMPQLQLNDRVTLIESNSGHSDDFIVIAIKHTPRNDGWTILVSLESLKAAWTYDPTRTTTNFPQYNNGAALVLPTIDITSNDAIEDDFANGTITHSVALTFTRPSQLNIANFLEGRILYREYQSDTTSWGRYITAGSFNDSYVNQYKVEGLLPDKKYQFYVIVTNKQNQQSPYGNGYEIDMPTTEELQATYGLIPAPTNVQLVKGLNKKVVASCAPTSAPHYKSVKFQLVKEVYDWTDSSVKTQNIGNTSATFDMPDDDNYKVRICFVDIWNREGTWSNDTAISGGGLSASDLSANFLEVKITSDVDPISGSVDNLKDGSDNGVVFDKTVVVTYKYPYNNVFDFIRVRAASSGTMYVEVKNSDGSYSSVVGTSTSPVNVIQNTDAGTANKFSFHIDGDMVNGNITRKETQEIRMTFLNGISLSEIQADTWRYLDTLQIGNGINIGQNLTIDSNGIAAVKNTEDQFRIDSLTGSAYFGGTMKAGIIDCESLDSRLSALFNSFGPNCVLPNIDGSSGLLLTATTGIKEYWINADLTQSVDSTKSGGSYLNNTYNYPRISPPNDYGNYQEYAYIHFPLGNYAGTLSDAKVQLYCTHNTNDSPNVYDVTSSWSGNTVWTNRPSWSLLFNGGQTQGGSYYTLSNSALTSLIGQWVNGTTTNYGIGLSSNLSLGSGAYTTFSGAGDGDSAKVPKLYIKMSGVPTDRNVSLQPGFFRIGSVIYNLSDTLTVTVPASSTKYAILTVDQVTKECTLSLIDSPSQLPFNSIIVGMVTTDSTTVQTPDMSRKTGRKDGSAAFSAFGVGGAGITSGMPAGDVWIGNFQTLASSSSISWTHNLGGNILDIRGQIKVNGESIVRNINTFYNGTGIEIVQTDSNTVTFYSGNPLHYTRSGGVSTSYTTGMVRPIIYLLQ